MADLEAPRPSRTRNFPPLPKPKAGRQVAFSDLSTSTVEPGRGNRRPCLPHRNGGKRCGEPCCLSCCAWVCLGVLAILLVAIVLAVSLVSFLQSELPRITAETCFLESLDVSPSTGRPPLTMDARAEVTLTVTNKNDKVEITFGPLTAGVWWEDMGLGLGQVRLPGFSQEPNSTTKLEVSTQVVNATVDEDSVQEIKREMTKRDAMLTVALRGAVGFHVGWFKMQGLPLLVRCADVSQAAVELGQEHICSVRIYAFS